MGAIKDFLKDFGSDMLAEFFSMGAMKKILTKGMAQKTAEKVEAKLPEIKFGGILDLSDETAFFGIIGKLEAEPDCKDYAEKITKFLNSLDYDWQRRKFRVVIGTLANIEYTKTITKESETIPSQKGGPTKKERVTEIKTNLAIEFLKSFARFNENQMKEVCEAAGIMDSSLDTVKKGIKNVLSVAKHIEESEAAQKVMTSLADKMRARIKTLRNRANNDIIIR
ncbi:MAG: hypothetical protein Q8N21_04555 [bacterium]|nr:hypothetical protein [bacterium]